MYTESEHVSRVDMRSSAQLKQLWNIRTQAARRAGIYCHFDTTVQLYATISRLPLLCATCFCCYYKLS